MKIELHKSVKKFLLRLQPKEQSRILNAIYKLPEGDVRPITSRAGKYRLRVGDKRVVFEYQKDIIFILEIDSRGSIYKK